jgi:hypothetical protein
MTQLCFGQESMGFGIRNDKGEVVLAACKHIRDTTIFGDGSWFSIRIVQEE